MKYWKYNVLREPGSRLVTTASAANIYDTTICDTNSTRRPIATSKAAPPRPEQTFDHLQIN